MDSVTACALWSVRSGSFITRSTFNFCRQKCSCESRVHKLISVAAYGPRHAANGTVRLLDSGGERRCVGVTRGKMDPVLSLITTTHLPSFWGRPDTSDKQFYLHCPPKVSFNTELSLSLRLNLAGIHTAPPSVAVQALGPNILNEFFLVLLHSFPATLLIAATTEGYC